MPDDGSPMSPDFMQFMAYMHEQWRKNGGKIPPAEPGLPLPAAPSVLPQARNFRVHELWKRYADEYGERHIDSWEDNNALHWKKQIGPFFGDLFWYECTRSKASEYRKKRSLERARVTGKIITASTRNREISTIKSCMEWAHNEGLIPENPLRGERYEKEVNDRDFHISEEDFWKIVRCSRPILKLMMVLWFETGCRRDEIRALEWSEVELSKDPGLPNVIKLPPEKTKAGSLRVIPLSDLAVQALGLVPRHIPSKFVFPNPSTNDGKPVPASTVWYWFREARKQAGIKGPRGQRIWIHSLRKSFGSLMSMGRVDESGQVVGHMPTDMLGDIAGWRNEAVKAKYRSMSPMHRLAATQIMNSRRPEAIELTKMLGEKKDDTKGVVVNMLSRAFDPALAKQGPVRKAAKRVEEDAPALPVPVPERSEG